MSLTCRHVGEYLFVEKGNRVSVEILDHFRQEGFDELDEEARQQFFEQAVVVDHAGSYITLARADAIIKTDRASAILCLRAYQLFVVATASS